MLRSREGMFASAMLVMLVGSDLFAEPVADPSALPAQVADPAAQPVSKRSTRPVTNPSTEAVQASDPFAEPNSNPATRPAKVADRTWLAAEPLKTAVYPVGDLPVWSRNDKGEAEFAPKVLIAHLKAALPAKAWKSGEISADESSRVLIIKQTKDNHQAIADALSVLRH